MFDRFLNSRVLIAFSDPGGAKAVLAIAEQLEKNNILIISDRDYDFYEDFNVDVVKVDNNFLSTIQTFNAERIITGTSYTSDIEKQITRYALANGIPCYSFIDHYTEFKSRFLLDDGLFLPQKVWVIDEKAKALAIEEGIEETKLEIVGSPYIDWLRGWLPPINREQFCEIYNIPINSKVIVYAPEPLTNVGGIDTYGLDEISVLEELLESLSNADSKELIKLIIKPHPNQNIKLFERVINSDKFSNIVLAEKTSTNTLIFHADVVVGIFSNILLEASQLGTQVIRYIKGLKINDPLKDKNVGTVINNREDLSAQLNENY